MTSPALASRLVMPTKPVGIKTHGSIPTCKDDTHSVILKKKLYIRSVIMTSGADPGGGRGSGTPLTTKNEAPAPKFYKIEAPEWQF